MRAARVILVFALLLLAVGWTGAAEPAAASEVSWAGHFGSPKADANTSYTLMAHGFFRAESVNVEKVMDAWLKDHPKAVVIVVMIGEGPVTTNNPLSRLAYVWVVQGDDNLTVELIRRGCFSPLTQKLNEDEKLQIPPEKYEAFVESIIKAGKCAMAEKLGIWAHEQD